jgi:hypothetical protein
MTDLLLNNINAFTKIAVENLELARMQRQQARSANSVNEHVAFIMQGRQYAMVAIVFSAFILEAYINNYAAKKGLKKHLDSLSFINKWIEIPKLATGKEFPKDQQCYSLLKELKRSRNELVHSKSKTLELENQADVKKIGDDVYVLVSRAEKAVETIFAVVKCLTEIDPEEKQYLSGPTTELPKNHERN